MVQSSNSPAAEPVEAPVIKRTFNFKTVGKVIWTGSTTKDYKLQEVQSSKWFKVQNSPAAKLVEAKVQKVQGSRRVQVQKVQGSNARRLSCRSQGSRGSKFKNLADLRIETRVQESSKE